MGGLRARPQARNDGGFRFKRLSKSAIPALHAGQIRKLCRSGVSKSEISRRLNIGRTSVRRILDGESKHEQRPVEFHKIWIDQCAATEGICEKFGLEDALNYLIGEKLFSFLHATEHARATCSC